MGELCPDSKCVSGYLLLCCAVGLPKSFTHVSTTQTSDKSHPLYDSSDEQKELTSAKSLNLFGEEMAMEELRSFEEGQEFTSDAQAFTDEIQAYTSSCSDEVDKEELIQDLRKIIQKYPSLIDSDSQYELSQLIAISSKNNCSIHLSAEELRELWNGRMETIALHK